MYCTPCIVLHVLYSMYCTPCIVLHVLYSMYKLWIVFLEANLTQIVVQKSRGSSLNVLLFHLTPFTKIEHIHCNVAVQLNVSR